MANLETKYLGLTLRNPLIVSSCGLTASLEKVKRAEEAGAGAVVLKSVFEEQIIHESSHLQSFSAYTEAADYLQFYLKEDYINKYLTLITEAKKQLSIPVIASVCCVSAGRWKEYACRLEAAGADALELNIFFLPTDIYESSESIERRYLRIVEQIVSVLKIPVVVKMGQHFTNMLSIVNGIEAAGAKGVVMFNRFFEPDININTIAVSEADILSTSAELRNSIRWVGMASAKFPNLDIVASTGVERGEDAVKVLLSGAITYEVCSTIYRNGLGVIEQINGFVSEWMDKNGFTNTSDFIGKLNYGNVSNPIAYERAQFMKYFASYE